jgi:transcriptional regulator with XRE-family HTH domain
MLSINIQTPASVMLIIRDNFKSKRLRLNLTQEGLSNRSGVSFGSVKRFESNGEISLKSLLKLAVVLECLDDFSSVAKNNQENINSMEQLLKQNNKSSLPKRGKIR